MERTPWRPQVRWLPMGGLGGAIGGAITALVGLSLWSLVAATDRGNGEGFWPSLGYIVVVGVPLGAIAGAAVGLVVGLEMMFLVGAHLSNAVARRRAHRLGYVLPPLSMAVAWLLLGGARDAASVGGATIGGVLLTAASLTGGPLARWLAGFGASGR